MSINNESIGIAVEVAIAKTFNVDINPAYVLRAEPEILDFLLDGKYIKDIFEIENLPTPISHIAEGQNPVDFILSNNKTLSVKTNQNSIGRAAPQHIGQPTCRSYFNYIETNNIISGFNLHNYLESKNMEDTAQNRAYVFKRLSIENIDILINMYWKNIFECDYLFFIYNLENKSNPLNNYRVFGKYGDLPKWDNGLFSFTQSLETWRESNTLKYDGISIGNFQVHNHRDCFKFRFNMKGIMTLLNSEKI